MNNSSDKDNSVTRKSADELSHPDAAELDRIEALADEQIDCSDIPELRWSSSDGQGRWVVLRLHEETIRLLRQKDYGPEQIEEMIRRQLEEQAGDAA